MSESLALYLEGFGTLPSAADVDAGSVDAAAPTDFMTDVRHAGLWRGLAALLGVHLLETGALLASWACIGSGALSGRFDAGWMAAWAMALGTTVPLRAATTWLQGVVAIGFGGLLKQRLLVGAMSLDADFIRSRGAGQLMSEVLESEAIDEMGSGGAVATALALLELLVVPVLFAWGAAGLLQIGILAAWAVLSGALFARNLRVRLAWTRQRVALTHRLVENMTAHRTRIAQQAPGQWHANDDESMEQYLVRSRELDRASAVIQSALPRAYVIAAVAGLAPAFLSGSATLGELAITLGAILYASASFERLCFGYSRSATAWIAWTIVKPIFKAADDAPLPAVAEVSDARGDTALQVRGVSFQYSHEQKPVLDACSFQVMPGDQILLEGNSGSGKSTLAAILSGARPPTEGYVLADGLDRHTMGDVAWRRRVALTPQYHENHIVSGSLMFNLLLARQFPHSWADIEEAEILCRELGLGELIDRMPAGLNQIVGDTGWRLSQGERSRIFLGRALLQKAGVVILDESLAALDPENLRQSLECIMRRAPTLIVIAHP
jgi:ATP-binding cassette, subfamily B, bacterial